MYATEAALLRSHVMSLAPRSFLVRNAFRYPLRRAQQRRGLINVHFGGSDGRGSRWPLVLSTFLGGAVATAVGGYTFYHWSGLKTAMDAIHHPIEFYRQYRNAQKAQMESGKGINGAQMETSAQILLVLRDLTKLYVAPIPGASGLVDLAFNEIEKVVDAHKDEARAILITTFNEVKAAVKARGEDSKGAGWDILAILRDRLGQIQALASAASQDKIGPLFERIPGFHEHAPRHISGVRDSLSPVYRKGLEKGKDVLSNLSRRLNTSVPRSNPSAEDDASADSRPQGQSQVEDHSSGSELPRVS